MTPGPAPVVLLWHAPSNAVVSDGLSPVIVDYCEISGDRPEWGSLSMYANL